MANDIEANGGTADMVHPVVVGSGKRLFEDGTAGRTLELLDSKTFGTGVVYLTYQPEGSR